MRSKFTYFVLAAAATLSAQAAQMPLLESGRSLYGYFNTEAGFDMDHGFASVNTADIEVPKLLFSFDEHSMSSVGVYGGAGLDGVLYCFDYAYQSMGSPVPGNLVSYDINTGMYAVIAPYGGGEYAHPVDATFDRNTGTMYALMGGGIVTVDLTTAEFTPFVSIKSDMGFVTLAADAAGEFYSIAMDGVLYKIDKTSGVISKVFDTGAQGFMFNQSMEFDPTTGHIIWAANVSLFDPNEMQLIEIDLSGEPSMEVLGKFGNSAVFNSLYLEGAASYDAPGNITDLSATYNAATESVTLTWTNPDKTFGGNTLEASALNGVEILKGGKSIAVLRNCEPGKTSSYTTTDLDMNAENRFSVIPFGTGGDGIKAITMVYVGADMPAAVTGAAIAGIDDYAAATLSWDAVTTGYHSGDFDAQSVRYSVYRRPDNVLVADKITETTVTDKNIRRTLNYYYDIIASNEIGTAPAVATANRILGPAFTCPFVEDFDDRAVVGNHWMINDANGDLNTWIITSSASTQFFGDAETGLEYMLSPIMGDDYDDADDWFISGPIKFEEGKNYEIDLTYRSLMPEVLEVYFGQSEEPDELALVESLELPASVYYEGDISIRPSYSIVNLPTEGKEMVGNVALRLVTPLGTLAYGFLQISNIEIIEQGTGSLGSISAPAVLARYRAGNFEVMGEFEKVEIYNVAGVKVAESRSAVTDMNKYDRGVYVAVVTGPAGRTAVKFAK